MSLLLSTGFEDHIKAWIGARNRTWLTGEPLNGTIFDAVQLNDRDSQYPNDTDLSCISMRNQGNIIIDSSCNMHPFPYFMCEIVV